MLHELHPVLDRTLAHCLSLTRSKFGFVGLTDPSGEMMDVAAIKGFRPTDPTFYDRFRMIPVRPTIFGVALREGRVSISNDVMNDPSRVGQPPGHPPVRTFLGVPLRLGDRLIGMIGVANHRAGYSEDDGRLLSTFANQAAVAIENARLIESHRELIEKLRAVNRELDEAEREQALQRERQRIAEELGGELERAVFEIGQRINSVLASSQLDAQNTVQLCRARSIAAKTAETAHPPDLNPRQVEILRLVAQGLTNREIASRVHLSENTIKTHLQTIFSKLSVRNRVEAAVAAASQRIT
ncbi:MAG TPA: GAF domain-containing protein [Candidatus Micrarchaeaceae archaeon]|nr:GAF domain-containing protein [Candidatus Micrarchaeaceae archaeon]